MESDESMVPPCQIPERIFALGDEPTGVRVTPYHKPCALTQIFSALDQSEVEVIRGSPFGRLVELAEKPSFSGRFGRYVISRQLKVSKKHEAWFLFAGKPVRFSLREFAIVTGLNCNRYPKRSKKSSKKHIKEKPYWGDLFGTLTEIPVSSVVRMLQRKTVADKDIRLKYAYLSLLAAVTLPTTHTPRISHVHAELIKDLDAFLAFPWGRVSFDMLMSSIKERKEVALMQNTIALKGFVLSLQLVMIKAVPALTAVVEDGICSGSEDENGEDEDGILGDAKSANKSISPGHARDIDAEAKSVVYSIIPDENNEITTSSELEWTDDEEDLPVQNLVTLIEQRFPFTHSCFPGGVSRSEVIRMREDAKMDAVNRKTSKSKATCSNLFPDVDADLLASMVKDKLKKDLQLMENKLSTFEESFTSFQSTVMSILKELGDTVELNFQKLSSYSEVLQQKSQSSTPLVHVGTQTVPEISRGVNNSTEIHSQSGDGVGDGILVGDPSVGLSKNGIDGGDYGPGDTILKPPLSDTLVDGITLGLSNQCETTYSPKILQSTIDPGLIFPNPTFSLGLTQEEPAAGGTQSVLTTHEERNPTFSLGLTQEEPTAGGTQSVPTTQEERNPTFSLGLTQEERNPSQQLREPNVFGGEGEPNAATIQGEVEDTIFGCRKSKRQKVPPKSLLGAYACDKLLLNRLRHAVADTNYSTGNIDYCAKFSKFLDQLKTDFSITTSAGRLSSSELYDIVERSTPLSKKVVDVLISHISSLFRSLAPPNLKMSCVFLNTHFISLFSKMFTKFTKVSRKDNFKFPNNLLEASPGNAAFVEGQRFYFPFNIDKHYWVAICVDCGSWTMSVLDCNIGMRTDQMMIREVRPLADMFPYLLKQMGKHIGGRDGKPLCIERPKTIPQVNVITDSAVASLLFIQAHAAAGVEVCKCITPDVLDSEIMRLLVTLYEGNVGPL